ncbi:MAG: hypothetical protein HGB32_05845 [Geobacteraceae bacterium]|nr:hypothetical protein [Geobacteraceae bacterium]NTW79653.1 hypothetical protein [Geobacteraceae bacterium]
MIPVTSNNTTMRCTAAIMKQGHCLLICFLATVVFTLLCSPALAAPAQFTLLNLEGLNQFVAVGYNFQDSLNDYETGKYSSSNHGFNESYSLMAGYSILHPRLLRGDVKLSLTSNQELASSTSQGNSSSSHNNITYSVSGVILNRKPYPVNFNVQSSTMTIRPPFSRAYNVDSESQSVSSGIQNRYLPLTFSYVNNESTSSGLDNDTRQSSTSASVSLYHNSGNLSSTSINLSQATAEQTLLGTGITDNRKIVTAEASNSLSWDNFRGLSRRLDTKYVYSEQSGSYPGLQSNLASALGWQIGKSLNSRLGYNMNNSQSVSNSSNRQNVNGALTHSYLKSLQTYAGGSYTKANYKDGTDVNTSWNAGANYIKKLPKDGQVGLTYGYIYSFQDRSRTEINQNVDEQVTIQSPFSAPQIITLGQPNIDIDSIKFYLDAGYTTEWIKTLTNYTVIPGTTTLIHITEDPGVPVLYLKYSYKLSPKIAYSTFGHLIGGRLSLLGDKHVLHSSYSWSDIQIISGVDPSSTIGGTTRFEAGLKSKLTPHTLSVNYIAEKSVYQDIRRVDTTWTHSMKVNNASLLSKAEDRYSWYKDASSSSAGSQSWDNVFKFSTAYNRSFVKTVKGTLTLGYVNLLTSSYSSNKFSLALALAAKYGRTDITLDSNSNWSFSSSGSSRNQSLTINARRSF